MNVLADNDELLKYIEIVNKIKALLYKKNNQKGLRNKPVYNNEYMKTKQAHTMKTFMANKKLTKMNIIAIQYYY